MGTPSNWFIFPLEPNKPWTYCHNSSWYGERVNKQFWHPSLSRQPFWFRLTGKQNLISDGSAQREVARLNGFLISLYCFKHNFINYFLCNDMPKYLLLVVPVLFWKTNISWRLRPFPHVILCDSLLTCPWFCHQSTPYINTLFLLPRCRCPRSILTFFFLLVSVVFH